MSSLWLDVRFACRTLSKRPGFALAAVLSLAVGIAANTAVFSVVDGLLFRGVPGVTRPERLVQLSQEVDGQWFDLSYPTLRQLRGARDVVEALEGYALVPASVAADGEPTVYGGLAVTSGYFDLLGVRPERGRLFRPGEASYPAVAPVAVVSHELWLRELADDGGAVGRSIRVNGRPVEVIGVLPPGFSGHNVGLLVDVFLPLGLAVPGLPGPASLDQPQSASVEVLARLRPGVTPEGAAVALSTAAARSFAEPTPGAEAGRPRIRVDRWGPLPGPVRGGVAAFLAVLGLLVALALTLACVNVTTMLLARSTERRGELAVRRALGAGRLRLVRLLVIEALVLFAVAGAAGATFAVWATGLLRSFSPRLPIPGRVGFELGLDHRVLAFAILVTLGSGLLFSLGPALRAGRFSLVPAMKAGSGGEPPTRTRLRSGLVGLQVAVTTLLLVAAGLFTGSLRSSAGADTGWRTEDVQVLDLDLELRGADPAEGEVFYRRLLERVRGLRGVEAAALAAKLPLAGCSSFGQLVLPGVEPPAGAGGFHSCLNRVSPGYFRTLRLPLLRGRDFTERDDGEAPAVAIVNETLASRLWPSGDAVGRRFYVGSASPENAIEVVGVAADARYRSRDEAPQPFYYVPAAQWYNSHAVLHVRTAAGLGDATAPALREAVRDLDPDLPLDAPRSLDQALELFSLPQRLAAWVASLMGTFALLLAAVGVYGITAFVVSARTREIGIRMALGATRSAVLRLVLGRGTTAPAMGMAVGLGVGAVFAQLVRAVVPGVHPLDPVAFGGVPLAIACVAALATLVPAARALGRDPLRALRHE